MTESTLMPASTDFLHTQQPAGPAESAMNTLYRAALGPIRPESYLPRFERFDTLGRTQPGWKRRSPMRFSRRESRTPSTRRPVR